MRKIAFGFFLGLVFLLIFDYAQAAGLVPCGGPGEKACELCDFFVMLDNIIDFLLLRIVPALAALMIAIGGGMYIISRGDPAMLSRAKRLFTAIVIGLVIIYGAWAIVGVFLMTIGLAEKPVNWYAIYRYWWEDGLFIIDCP